MIVDLVTREEFELLKAKVEAAALPQNVKDAMQIVISWLISQT